MKSWAALCLLLACAGSFACNRTPAADPIAGSDAQPVGTGTIKGHVVLTGTPPDNPVIRMRADPMCETANAGQRAVMESVVAAADGSLRDVFVQLEGSFADTPPPSTPVTVDQRACIYKPRVVGLQLGQTLRVLNSDPGLHNVHGVQSEADAFNIGQPMAGISNDLHPKNEGMLRLQCDVHMWMLAYVGVVNHPYFGVTGPEGTFELRNVPAGTHTIKAWHEKYGVLTSTVRVEPNGVADVQFTYSADQKPAGSS